MTNDPKVIVALDYNDAKSALEFVERVEPSLCKLKVGKELFTAAGPALVEELVKRNFKVFLDLKFHDIPNTVAKALQAAANLGVWMVNVHTLGGLKMLQAAAESLANIKDRPLLIGVTILTSMDEEQLQSVGIESKVQDEVLKLAKLAYDYGLDGVVSSAMEANLIKKSTSSQFLTVTPGIRPSNSDLTDQVRVMTPIKALENGADYLVIGRPITKSSDPIATLTQINEQIARA